MNHSDITRDALLTPSEVADLFRVDSKTVTRWAKAGKLRAVRTPGGHRRFRAAQVRALLDADGGSAAGVVAIAVSAVLCVLLFWLPLAHALWKVV